MNPIDKLKKEHENIERELLELETIMEDMGEGINYPNLVHVFKKLCYIWDEHEENEEKIFPILEKEKIKVPVEKMLFEHKELKKYKKKILNAINSGSEYEIKKALEDNCEIIIKKLREHISDEDEVLYTITLEEFTPEELQELWGAKNEK